MKNVKQAKPSIEQIENILFVPDMIWREKHMADEPEGKLICVDFTKRKVISEDEWMGYAIRTALKAG